MNGACNLTFAPAPPPPPPSLSLSVSRGGVGEHYPVQSTLEAPPLVVPDFTLSSSTSSLVHVTINGTITEVSFNSMYIVCVGVFASVFW